MARREIVTVGASAGGVQGLIQLAGGLPEGLAAAIFVVVHVPEDSPSVLPKILSRGGPLPAAHPEDGEPVERGRIYVAPPGAHLLVERGRVRVRRGPKENRHRPAVDPLLRTAALDYGPQVIGVVLSGYGTDGTAGLAAIKRRGGVAVVQDPSDAPYPGMPASALEYVDADYCLPLHEIPPLLVRLVQEQIREGGAYPVPDEMEYESKVAGLDPAAVEREEPPGKLSGLSCPECAGPLYELHDGSLVRYRCRVGHAYTADSVLEEKDEALESALYLALNTLEESAQLSERLAARSRVQNHLHAAERFEERAREARQRATLIRRVLTGPPETTV